VQLSGFQGSALRVCPRRRRVQRHGHRRIRLSRNGISGSRRRIFLRRLLLRVALRQRPEADAARSTADDVRRRHLGRDLPRHGRRKALPHRLLGSADSDAGPARDPSPVPPFAPVHARRHPPALLTLRSSTSNLRMSTRHGAWLTTLPVAPTSGPASLVGTLRPGR
jgi:hypothetical protein